MSDGSQVDRLDRAIDGLLARREAGDASVARGPLEEVAEVAELAEIAAALRDLPSARFRAWLKRDLQERTAHMTQTAETPTRAVQSASPQLRVRNAAAAIDFYIRAFGAREVMRFEDPDRGMIPHAEIDIGGSIVIVADEAPEYGYPGPEELGGSPVRMHLRVNDADATVRQAVAAGARLVVPVKDQFYGDRSGEVADPFGYRWNIAAHVEDVSNEEMQRRSVP